MSWTNPGKINSAFKVLEYDVRGSWQSLNFSTT